MPTQTRTWQNKILAEAERDGYEGLYWFIEMQIPGNRHAPASYPREYIPVIVVKPDPEITRHWAHLLSELFASNNPATIYFSPALTHVDSLKATGAQWYIWGATDLVCEWCGAVGWASCTCGPVIRRVTEESGA